MSMFGSGCATAALVAFWSALPSFVSADLGHVSGLEGGYAPAQIRSNRRHTLCLMGDNMWVSDCHFGGDNQMWYFSGDQMKNLGWATDQCLTVISRSSLMRTRCTGRSDQKWGFSGDTIMNDAQGGDPVCLFLHASPVSEGFGFGTFALQVHPCTPFTDGMNWTIGGRISVTGYWKPLRPLIGTQTITFSHGTSKTTTVTKSEMWSASVTAAFEVGIGVNSGVGTASATSSLELSAGLELSAEHSEEFASETTTGLDVEIEAKDGEQYLWQWEYDVSMEQVVRDQDDVVRTQTKAYAATKGLFQTPKCAPGFCLDNPRCQQCHPRGLLEGSQTIDVARAPAVGLAFGACLLLLAGVTGA